jgi:hypothetical protein
MHPGSRENTTRSNLPLVVEHTIISHSLTCETPPSLLRCALRLNLVSHYQKSSLYSLSSFNAPAESLVRISNFTDDPTPKITTLDTNKIYDASVPTGLTTASLANFPDIQLPVGASNFTYYSYEPSMVPPQRTTHPLNTYVMKSGFPVGDQYFASPPPNMQGKFLSFCVLICRGAVHALS